MTDTTDWRARALAAEAKLDAIAATLRDLPAPKAQRKVIALIDRDGDRWDRGGTDDWIWAAGIHYARSREHITRNYSPVTEVYEDDL